ncbi:MAG TPA: hypothetical protein VGP72_27130 [Planctomycetota bacterium]|jgi:hypothetical protein
MARFSGKQYRQRVKAMRRESKREEAEFARVLDSARKQFPVDADHPLFPFLVRLVWRWMENADDSWQHDFAQAYQHVREKYRWVMGHAEVKGRIRPQAYKVLAHILVALRRRQKLALGN